MIWWPFNAYTFNFFFDEIVVTHQWSGDPSMKNIFIQYGQKCRNSPMIWWPFNAAKAVAEENKEVVTHQWSGDPSIISSWAQLPANSS